MLALVPLALVGGGSCPLHSRHSLARCCLLRTGELVIWRRVGTGWLAQGCMQDTTSLSLSPSVCVWGGGGGGGGVTLNPGPPPPVVGWEQGTLGTLGTLHPATAAAHQRQGRHRPLPGLLGLHCVP